MMATADVMESFGTNNDVFDAEMEDSDDGAKDGADIEEKNSCPEQEDHLTKPDIFDDETSPRNSSDSDDERLEEEASKRSQRQRSPKPRRLKKAAIQSIHSECQKMLRESVIKLPYHKPAAKPITHFLTRVPHTSNTRIFDQKINKNSTSEKEIVKVDDYTPISEQSQGKPDKVANKPVTIPKLSNASDPFFCGKTQGIQSLLQRFAKHTSKPKNAAKEVKENNATESKEKTLMSQTDKLEKGTPGGSLKILKEQLESKMKTQRAELRKIHQSQWKLDNEEISGEEEEEEEMTEEESDSDYELDKWNEADKKKQEEGDDDDDDAPKSKNEFIDEEADEDDYSISNNFDGINSGSDGDVSDEGDSDDDKDSVFSDDKQIRRKKRHKVKKYRKVKETVPMQEEETLDLFNINSNSQTGSEGSKTRTSADGMPNEDTVQSLCLRLDSIDEDEEISQHFTKTKEFKSPTSTNPRFTLEDTSQSSLSFQASSDDSIKIQAAQGGGSVRRVTHSDSDRETPEPFSMLPRISRHILGSNEKNKEKTKKAGKLSQLTLPIEYSQDLFDDESNATDKSEEKAQEKVTVTRNFSFALEEDTQFSQMLDTQGFLFSKKPENPKPQNSFNLGSTNGAVGMEEILGLCSGQFSTNPMSEGKPKKVKPLSLLGTTIEGASSQPSSMSELLGLCSGVFGNDNESSMQAKGSSVQSDSRAEKKHVSDADDDSSEEDEKNDKEDDQKADVEDHEDIEDGDNTDDDDNSVHKESNTNELRSKKSKKIFDKKKFYEDEAELSGSDFGSDEDDDINTDEDILEEESDLEDLPSDEELQEQINRVHMKSIFDQDKAELRIMQDIYLPDGDLHGEGRKRNFRWRGIDSSSQFDLFDNKLWNEEDHDQANVELLTEEECNRRKERFERDTFLREELKKGNKESIVDMDEDSQVILNIIKDTSKASPALVAPENPQQVSIKPVTPAPRLQRIPSQKGSFLNRSKATLTRLSSITANKPNASTSSRTFVFKTVQAADKDKMSNSKKMPRTASMSEPAAKRPKIDRSISDTPNSIFSML